MSTKKMTLSQVMKYLEQQGDEKVRMRYVRDGAGDNVFGVLLGTIRRLAETLGPDHELGLELWATGNHEARVLACMVLDPEVLTEKEARALIEPLSNPTLVDELVGRMLVRAPIAAALQARWMDGSDELPRRAGWRILAGRIERGSVKELDVGATLARIERELPPAPYRVKRHVRADRPARAWGEEGESYRGRGYCCAVASTRRGLATSVAMWAGLWQVRRIHSPHSTFPKQP